MNTFLKKTKDEMSRLIFFRFFLFSLSQQIVPEGGWSNRDMVVVDKLPKCLYGEEETVSEDRANGDSYW